MCRGAVNDMEQYQKSFGLNGKGSSTGIVFMIYNVSLLHNYRSLRFPSLYQTNGTNTSWDKSPPSPRLGGSQTDTEGAGVCSSVV